MPLLALLPLTGQVAPVATPAPGSRQRTAILDAVRPYAFKRDAAGRKFNVQQIRTDGTAAIVRCAPADEDEATWSDRFSVEGDLTTFFLRRRSGGWRLLGSLPDFHEGGAISVYDLRALKRMRFPMRLLIGSDDPGLARAAGGRYLFALDERLRPMPITASEADRLARAKSNPKLHGRYAQITRFRPV